MFRVVVRCTVYLKCKLCPDHPDPQNVKIIRKDTPDPQNVKVIKKDPHLKKQVKQIGGVQRRAARFVKNCYTQEPGTVTNFLNKLTWIPLKVQRTILPVTLFHKAIHGDSSPAFQTMLCSAEDI